jgi:hypothetical protein
VFSQMVPFPKSQNFFQFTCSEEFARCAVIYRDICQDVAGYVLNIKEPHVDSTVSAHVAAGNHFQNVL